MIDSLTKTEIFNNSTFIFQRKTGYRFSADSLILSFHDNYSLNSKKINKIMEIGSGSGIIPIILNKRGFKGNIECVEIQKNMFEILKLNIKENNLEQYLTPINSNFLSLDIKQERYDIIFSNPPYYTIKEGIINPDSEKAFARHEFFGTIDDFIAKSSKILKKKSNLFLIYPLAKLQKLLSKTFEYGLFLKNLTIIKEYEETQPTLFLAMFIKGLSSSNLKSFDTIVMKNKNGEYTDIGKRIMYDTNR